MLDFGSLGGGWVLSRALCGDGIATVAVPLVIGVIVLISWALRPAGRSLEPPSAEAAPIAGHNVGDQ